MKAQAKEKIAIVVYSYYPHDLRIRRAAEAALKSSYDVDVFCLIQRGQNKLETHAGLKILRQRVLRSRSKRINYIIEYLSFLAVVLIKLSARHLSRRYSLIHVNNMPDILVLTGLLAKLTGAKIVLDLHDPMPEVFMTKYATDEKNTAVKLLLFLERASIRFSDKVITTNIAFRDLFVGRGCPRDKIAIVMNAPDEAVFSEGGSVPPVAVEPGGPFRVVFNGTIVGRHGLDAAIDAVLKLKDRIPHISFDIYGDGDAAERVVDRIRSLGEGTGIRFRGFVHIEELVKIIRNAHVGVIPNIRSVFTEINFPVRIFEYLELGKPIIAPNTRGVRDYFSRNDLLMFEPGDPDDLAEKIHFVYSHPEATREIVRKGRVVYQRHSWRLQREVLTEIYAELAGRSHRAAMPAK